MKKMTTKLRKIKMKKITAQVMKSKLAQSTPRITRTPRIKTQIVS